MELSKATAYFWYSEDAACATAFSFANLTSYVAVKLCCRHCCAEARRGHVNNYRCFLHVTMTIDSRSSYYELVFMFCVLDAKVNATEVNDAFLSLIFHNRRLIKTIKHIRN